MSELSNNQDRCKLLSKEEVRAVIRQRVESAPTHLKGREVVRIAAELKLTTRRIYQIVRE